MLSCDGVRRGGVERSVMGRTGKAVMGWRAARRNEIRWLQLL